MAVNKSAAMVELGAELKKLRTDSGLNVRQMGKLAGGLSGASVSFWENGERLIAVDRLTNLLNEMDVPDERREYILGLHRRADTRPGELVAGATSIGPTVAQIIDYEETSREITHWELGIVPGLLQTAEYARAVIGDVPDATVRVKLRIGRREILTRKPSPVEFLALIDSEVLVRPIAPPAVMARQLRHLLEMQELPNVTIQVVPATLPGFHPGLHGSFKIFRFPSASPVVHVENYRASPFLWDEEFVADYITAAEEIQKKAMTPERSSEVIAEMLHGLE